MCRIAVFIVSTCKIFCRLIGPLWWLITYAFVIVIVQLKTFPCTVNAKLIQKKSHLGSQHNTWQVHKQIRLVNIKIWQIDKNISIQVVAEVLNHRFSSKYKQFYLYLQSRVDEKSAWEEIKNAVKSTPTMVFSVIGDSDSFVPRPWPKTVFQTALIEAVKSGGGKYCIFFLNNKHFIFCE